MMLCLPPIPPQAPVALVAFALRGLAGATSSSPSSCTLLPAPASPGTKMWGFSLPSPSSATPGVTHPTTTPAVAEPSLRINMLPEGWFNKCGLSSIRNLRRHQQS